MQYFTPVSWLVGSQQAAEVKNFLKENECGRKKSKHSLGEEPLDQHQ